MCGFGTTVTKPLRSRSRGALAAHHHSDEAFSDSPLHKPQPSAARLGLRRIDHDAATQFSQDDEWGAKVAVVRDGSVLITWEGSEVLHP
jgi:hypothetical protein